MSGIIQRCDMASRFLEQVVEIQGFILFAELRLEGPAHIGKPAAGQLVVVDEKTIGEIE